MDIIKVLVVTDNQAILDRKGKSVRIAKEFVKLI